MKVDGGFARRRERPDGILRLSVKGEERLEITDNGSLLLLLHPQLLLYLRVNNIGNLVSLSSGLLSKSSHVPEQRQP